MVVGVWRVYLVLGQAAADGTGLLGAEVEGEQLLLLVRLPQRRLLLLRDHREHARDRGAHHLAEEPQGTGIIRLDSVQFTSREYQEKIEIAGYAHLGELVGCAAGNLGYAEEGELRLELLELRLQVRLALPPELVHLDTGCQSSPHNKRGVRSARR